MSQYLIKTLNLTKIFNDNTVINDFNYLFEKDKIYLLIGHNGSGKSTLIKLLLGLYYPNKGIIERNYKQFRYVPELLPINSNITVETYINHITKLLKEKRDKELEKLLLLETTKKLKELSKGNTKKVLLYLSFIGTPEIIYLDEPLDGLDQGMQEVVVNYMKNRNICYIVSSHNLKYFNSFKEVKVINLD